MLEEKKIEKKNQPKDMYPARHGERKGNNRSNVNTGQTPIMREVSREDNVRMLISKHLIVDLQAVSGTDGVSSHQNTLLF